jgi:hypothetical protein
MYILCPLDGWPRVVDAEPTPSRVSDELGSTFDSVTLSSNFALNVVDSEVRPPINLAASAIASFVTNELAAVCGPAVFVGLELQAVELITGSAVAKMQPLPADEAQALCSIGRDLLYADAGVDNLLGEGFTDWDSVPFTRADHARRCREMITELRRVYADHEKVNATSVDNPQPLI